MIRQYVTLDLSGEKYKIIEPTISDLFMIDELLKDTENVEENIRTIYSMLDICKNHIHLANIIIPKVLNGFGEKTKKNGERNYFLGICGLLAHHNHLDLRSFIEKYTLNDLGELLKVHEYYHNLMNGKSSENSKFFDKSEASDEYDREVEEFIAKMT